MDEYSVPYSERTFDAIMKQFSAEKYALIDVHEGRFCLYFRSTSFASLANVITSFVYHVILSGDSLFIMLFSK